MNVGQLTKRQRLVLAIALGVMQHTRCVFGGSMTSRGPELRHGFRGNSFTLGVTRVRIEVGSPTPSITLLEISFLSPSATVIKCWKRTPGVSGDSIARLRTTFGLLPRTRARTSQGCAGCSVVQAELLFHAALCSRPPMLTTRRLLPTLSAKSR